MGNKNSGNRGKRVVASPTFSSELVDTLTIGIANPLPKQKLVMFSDYLIRAYVGGFGSGKTKMGCSEGIIASIMFSGNRGIICRENYPALLDSTIKTFFNECPEQLISKYNKNEKRVLFKNGSEILFRNTKNPDDFKSTEIGWFLIDEADGVEEKVFKVLLARLRINTVPSEYYFGNITTNPPDEDHWICDLFVKNKPDNYLFVHAPSYENPYLPDGYIKNLEDNYDADWVRVFLGGEFGYLPTGKRVYQEFSKKLHCKKLGAVSPYPIYRAWDFGFHNPACVFFQEIEGVMHVLKEMEGKNELVDVFAKRVISESMEEYPGFLFEDFGDPAGNQRSDKSEKSSIQIIRAMGIKIRTRVSHINDGLLIIRILMHPREVGSQLFYVDPRCDKLIKGFIGAYHYPDKKDADEKKKPKKDNTYDHVQDCLRYGVVNNPRFRKWLKKPSLAVVNTNSFNSIRKRNARG